MVPALSVDGRAGPPLPSTFRVPDARPRRQEKKSPLPEDWSEGTRRLRELVEQIEDLTRGR